jgi:hypothetical protein
MDVYGQPYYMYVRSPYFIDPVTKRTALFLQDQWAISDRITINWGLRWNRWRGSTSADGTIFKPKDGWAPRLGITVDLLGDHTTALKLHYGRYYHGIMGMWFGHWSYAEEYSEYVHGDILNMWAEEEFEEEGEPFPDEYPWPSEYVLDFEESFEAAYTIDPNLKYPHVDNFVIGLERELGRDMIFGVSYISRRNKNFIDNVNLSGMWAPTEYYNEITGETYNIFERLNPGENDKYVTNPEAGKDYGQAFADIIPYTPTRKYWGLEFTFRKRFSNRWQFMAAYTYSKATGSNSNAWGEYEENRTSSLGASVLYLNPNWSYNAEGTMRRDHPHIVKLAGSYVLPLDITFGVFYQYFSGETYNRNIRVPREIDNDPVGLFADDIRIYGEEVGSFREPARHNLDMRLEKFFTFGERFRLGLLIDMFNVFNSNTPTSLETRIEQDLETQLDRGREDFQFVRGIRSPRTFRLGVHFEF